MGAPNCLGPLPFEITPTNERYATAQIGLCRNFHDVWAFKTTAAEIPYKCVAETEQNFQYTVIVR